MNDILIAAVYLVAGTFAGLLSGLLGIGGGIIFIPVLFTILPHQNVSSNEITFVVVATSMFAGSFASLSSFYTHLKKQNLSVKHGLLISSGSLPGAFITPRFIISWNPFFIKVLIIALMLLVLLRLLILDRYLQKNENQLSDWVLPIIGLLIGILSSIGGLGGGVFYLPVLFTLCGLDMKTAIGTSSIAVMVTMVISAFSFAILDPGAEVSRYSLGYVELFSGTILATGAFIGAKSGAGLTQKFSETILKRIFSLFLLAVIIKMLTEL